MRYGRKRVIWARRQQRTRGAVAALFLFTTLSFTACSRRTEPHQLYEKALAAFSSEHYNDALALIPSDPLLSELKADEILRFQFRVLEGEALAGKGEYTAAVERLELPPATSGFESNADLRRRMALGLARCRLAKDSVQREAALRLLSDTLADTQPGSLDFGKVQLRRGTCLVRMERFDEGEAAYRAAGEAAKNFKDSLLEARVLSSLGALYTRRDKYDAAASHMARAHELARTLGAPGKGVANRALDNLGWLYYELGDLDRALDTLQKFEPANDRERLINQQNLANTWLMRGDFERAEGHYAAALDASRRIQDRLQEAQVMTQLAYLNVKRGNPAKAEEWNSRALVTHRELRDSQGVLRNLFYQALIHSSEPELRALTVSKATTPEILWSAHVNLARLYAASHRYRPAETEFRKAIELVEQGRSTIDEAEFKISFLSGRMEVYREAIRFYLDTGRAVEALHMAARCRARTLSDRAGGFSTSKAEAPVLFYSLGEESSQLWVVTASGATFFRLPAAPEIRSLVEKHNEYILRARDPLLDNTAEARRLFEILVAPALSQLKAGPVFISPDDVLHSLNWETLVAPNPDHYWVEDMQISVIPSLEHIAGRAESSHSGRILLIGDALEADSDFPRLLHAGSELQQIAQTFGASSQSLLQNQATPRNARDALLGDYQYIHFAAHAAPNAMRPLESSIILSPNAGAYKLYARDILGQTINAKLVTLSACRAAGARTYSGEGLVGFAWAFLGAGAENVVASLWNVEDASTARLMDEMYRQIRLGRPPAQALREAKLAFLRSNSALRKPYFWAPFLHFRR